MEAPLNTTAYTDEPRVTAPPICTTHRHQLLAETQKTNSGTDYLYDDQGLVMVVKPTTPSGGATANTNEAIEDDFPEVAPQQTTTTPQTLTEEERKAQARKILPAIYYLLLFDDPKDETAYWVQTDHLGSPHALKDQSKTVVWQWNIDQFLAIRQPNQDPDNDGNQVTFNLRYPGQYYDSTTGLHYNTFRYYDPQTGRYITSDPIGLAGGLNTYLYANANPLYWIDPDGLSGIDIRLNHRIDDLISGNVSPEEFLDQQISGSAVALMAATLLIPDPTDLLLIGGASTLFKSCGIATKGQLALPTLQVANAGGKNHFGDLLKKDEVFFRVFSGNSTAGGFLTRVAPTSRNGAIEGLALPPGNTAEFIQRVLVPAGTRLQRSRALPAFGRRGGKETILSC